MSKKITVKGYWPDDVAVHGDCVRIPLSGLNDKRAEMVIIGDGDLQMYAVAISRAIATRARMLRSTAASLEAALMVGEK